MPFCFCFLWALCLWPAVLGCSPPPPNPFSNQQPISASPRHTPSRLFGEQTQQGTAAEFAPAGIDRASALSGPVRAPEELYCYDFDDKCRWRNMEGLLVDELDWYQGAGFLDENRLRLATGTHLTPEGFYGIAATDKVEFTGAKAILVSDVIECQSGVANLRFMYWTSPEVKITVCVKSVLRLFPYFDYCSKPIENGDPGPVFVTLPEINEPMQIFIQAHNFVFNSAALQGGFAIIDNLEYFGEFCEREGNGLSNFAAARVAPPQSALRAGYQQLIPQNQKSEGNLVANAVNEQQPIKGPYQGFRSLLDWMIYGGNGLAGMRTLQELLNVTSSPNSIHAPLGGENSVQLETVAPPPPPPPPARPQLLVTEQPPLVPQFPPELNLPTHELRSIRIVQREMGTRGMGIGGEEDGGGQAPALIEPMDIRKSILLNGQMPANSYIRKPKHNLEMLARKNGGGEARRRVEEAGEGEGHGKEQQAGDEEGGMEEEMEPSQVEREEWIG